MMIHTKGDLQQMQSLPLSAKILMTKRRIREWYDYWDGQVYVSFSGGKDSTVLLHIARELYPDIEAVFVNTGLEYPEIQSFVKTFDNVTILRPKMRFDEVIKKYGYPIISKEVSECIYQGRLALKTNGEKYPYRLSKLFGTAKDKNGNKSIFYLQSLLLQCYEEKASKTICKTKWQETYNGSNGKRKQNTRATMD